MEIDISKPILDRNEKLAKENRSLFAEKGIFVVDLMASPGAGKTSVILATIAALRDRYRIAVIEGDIASKVDAEKITSLLEPICELDNSQTTRAQRARANALIGRLHFDNNQFAKATARFDQASELNPNDLVLLVGRGRLALFGDPEAPMLFRVVDLETLRKLDLEGRDIESSLNYDLRRKDAIGTIEPRLTMRGMYRYMADAALFEECLSGRRFQVAQEADNIALERAYLEAQRQPGEALLVSIQGRIAEHPAMEGDAMVLTVVPEHFIGVWPGETCGARMTTSELLNTRWKLTRLGDEPVVLAEIQREPYLVLASQDNRVSGFGGCNRFNGSYEIEGRSITFGPIASTKMACIPGGDTERAFLAALGKVTSFHKTAHHLELLDADGTIVTRFEARDLE